jgi:hypothetical protein
MNQNDTHLVQIKIISENIYCSTMITHIVIISCHLYWFISSSGQAVNQNNFTKLHNGPNISQMENCFNLSVGLIIIQLVSP